MNLAKAWHVRFSLDGVYEYMLSLCKSSTYSHRIWESYQKNTIFNKSQKITIQQKILSKHILQIFFLNNNATNPRDLSELAFRFPLTPPRRQGPGNPVAPSMASVTSVAGCGNPRRDDSPRRSLVGAGGPFFCLLDLHPGRFHIEKYQSPT